MRPLKDGKAFFSLISLVYILFDGLRPTLILLSFFLAALLRLPRPANKAQ
jgi:hypothetical protein